MEADRVRTLFSLRGYKVVELKETAKEGLFVVDAEKGGVSQKFVVKVVPSNKIIGTAVVREVREKIKEIGAGKGIIVGGKRSTPIAEDMADESGIELLVDYPPFNIFEHELVPKHEVLSEEEKKLLLETFHVKEDQLPKIKDTDPAVKAIGAKPGDIIRIIRKSPTAGGTVFYRYVVKARYAPQIAKEEMVTSRGAYIFAEEEEAVEEREEREEEWEEL
ncbi:MAG: DNA-directed RNA polymerase subunit H [Candidatus Jordarchaeales archaeon]